MAKLILNEKSFDKLIANELLKEEFSKKDAMDIVKNDHDFENRVKNIVKNTLKNDSDAKKMIQNDKDLEKKIKEITANVLDKYFKIMWQRSSFYSNELKN